MITIDEAFTAYPRINFLPRKVRGWAYEDRPLVIGYNQTNSQPSTVRQMLVWLDVREGQTICDVGSGSGWTTALLSVLTGKTGYVHAVERIPQLVAFGRRHCRKVGVSRAAFHQATRVFGWPNAAPYDRILVNAAAHELPYELVDQLKVGGKMVIPVKNDILEITKQTGKQYTTVVHHGFIFVPLIDSI